MSKSSHHYKNEYKSSRYRDSNQDNRFFRNKDKQRKVFFSETEEEKEPKEYTVKDTEFPCLNSKVQIATSVDDKPNISFVDIAKENIDKNVDDDTIFPEKSVEPGWVSFKMNKNTKCIEVEHGTKTEYMKKLDFQKKREENLNYSMNKAIQNIQKHHLIYEILYDEIHGEGEYSRLYRYNDCIDDSENEGDDELSPYHLNEDDNDDDDDYY